MRIDALLLILLTVVGCGSERARDGLAQDASSPIDAGLADGGSGDATSGDATSDGGIDAGQPDAVPDDTGVLDATGSDTGAPGWTVMVDNDILEIDGLIATHPTLPEASVVTSSDDMIPFFSVWKVSGGVATESVIYSFTPELGFFAYPRSIAYDPADGNRIVASTEPLPAPDFEQAVMHAWSTNGGTSFDYNTSSFTNPWPPDEMKFLGGTTSELVWRASRTFFFSDSLGEYNSRVESIATLPAACNSIAGYSIPSDNHDLVALWCANGAGAVCDLLTDQCRDLTLPGGALFRQLRFAPSNPDCIYALSSGTNSAVYRSTDRGFTSVKRYDFDAFSLLIDPNNDLRACARGRAGNGELHCTANGGDSWRSLTPPTLDPPYATIIRDIAFGADGSLWAIAHPGVIHLLTF